MFRFLLSAAFFVTLHVSGGEWRSLFNGRNLDDWEVSLAGEKRDTVFSVVPENGKGVLRVSGEIIGALYTREQFTNFHFRVEYRWGEKRWPPRENAARDSGIFYCASGAARKGSGWFPSMQCNIMERGTGQWWSVEGVSVDVEGVRVDAAMEKEIPYKKESEGERLIVYRKGAPLISATPSDAVTPSFDAECPRGEWNSLEVIFWDGICIHVLNGKVTLVLRNPRYTENGKEHKLRSGRIGLQSEFAEIFFRRMEAKHLTELPGQFTSVLK